MKRVTAALVICLLGQSVVRADEMGTDIPNGTELGERNTLSRAITFEAARLAKSAVLERRMHSSEASNKTDTRPWCVRHGTGCFALIGYAVGFIGGLLDPADDFAGHPGGWALVFSGPIGAGIGAAVGWGIEAGTKPQARSQQP